MAGALNKHIALVGFMGAGKSTLGRQVAERLGRNFVDVDAELENVTGRSIPQLFDEGEAFFRTKEAKATVERFNVGDLLTSASGSTGGELVSSGTIFGGAALIGLVNIVLLTATAISGFSTIATLVASCCIRAADSSKTLTPAQRSHSCPTS